MTGTFKANNPNNNFLLFIYAVALKFPLFLHPQGPQAQPLDGVLYHALLDLLQVPGKNFPLLYPILSFSLVYLQALGFNKAVNTQRLFQKPNYLTAMSYILITALFHDWFLLSAPLIVNTMLIWIWAKLCALHNSQESKTSIYNIGLVTGIAAFFYFPVVAFIILIMVGLTIARPFKITEWLIVFIGLATPFYFFASWLYLTDKWRAFRLPRMMVSLPGFHESKWAYAAIALILLTAIIGSFFIRNNLRRQVVQTRKSWQLLFLYLIVAALVPFLNMTHSFTYWILIAVPVSLLMAGAFLYPDRKWFPQFMHWTLVAISVAVGYFA